MKTINVELSPSGVDKAIKELIAYRDSLDGKLKKFLNMLADVGLDSISTTVAQIDPNDLGRGYGQLLMDKQEKPSGEGQCKMTIFLEGEDVLFIEFSAGITFGTDSYPLPSGDGYGMGTYPDGKGHWDDPEGWFYRDENDVLRHSYGNPAYMPMYHAREAMAIRLWMIAQMAFYGV